MNIPSIKNGLLILHGYNAGLRVWNRQLVCKYGTADEAGELNMSKVNATSLLRHIIVVGGDGMFTTEAVRWLSCIQISLTVIENNGQVLLSLGRQNHPYATLARRQALAVYQNNGLNIAHWLITEKMRGQAENLDAMSISSNRIREEMKAIQNTSSTEEVMIHEARAAAHYWTNLENVPLTFIRKDQKRIPSHWFSLGKRMSPISKRAMHAATPGQAMLNYLYGVAESLCSIQLASVGLNPDVGIIHADVDNRRSMALDLIETIRPGIDKIAFQYFQKQVFSKSDFWETERGSVRIGLDVRKTLISNAFLLENQTLEYAIKLRDWLTDNKTPLTRKRRVERGNINTVHVCKYCGTSLPKTKVGYNHRDYCNDCLQIQKHEKLSNGNSPGFRWSESALTKHSQTSRIKRLEILQWEAQYPENELQDIIQRERQRFIVEIFPGLQSLTVTRISKQVGISLRYASLVKKGLSIPHPCLYDKFQNLLGSKITTETAFSGT